MMLFYWAKRSGWKYGVTVISTRLEISLGKREIIIARR